MKKSILFSFVLLLMASSLYAQEDKIKVIRSRYAKVNQSVSSCTKKDYKDALPDGLNEAASIYNLATLNVTKFSKNGEVQKIVAKYSGRMEDLTSEYYYWNGRLFFVFTTLKKYSKNKDMNGFDKNDFETIQNRYYFDDSQMIKWLDKDKKSVSVHSEDYSNARRNYIADGEKMKTVE